MPCIHNHLVYLHHWHCQSWTAKLPAYNWNSAVSISNFMCKERCPQWNSLDDFLGVAIHKLVQEYQWGEECNSMYVSNLSHNVFTLNPADIRATEQKQKPVLKCAYSIKPKSRKLIGSLWAHTGAVECIGLSGCPPQSVMCSWLHTSLALQILDGLAAAYNWNSAATISNFLCDPNGLRSVSWDLGCVAIHKHFQKHVCLKLDVSRFYFEPRRHTCNWAS